MSEQMDYRVRLPKSWKGPRRVSISVGGVNLFLSLNENEPALLSKDVSITEEQAGKLRQNGLSVRVLGSKKPGQAKE